MTSEIDRRRTIEIIQTHGNWTILLNDQEAIESIWKEI
jgi:hypothetical protein